MNLGLDPNDPRYQKMLRDMIRSGKIDPATMESQVAQAANAPMTSGDMSGYVDEAQAEQKKKAFAERSADFSGQERKIKNQRDYADSLRGRAAPQGRNVGPLNVYHGPNWGESLAHATGEVMGGYMAGKANRADEGLDKARTAQKAAEQAEERGRYDTEQARETAKFDRLLGRDEVEDEQFGVTTGLASDKVEIARGVAAVNAADQAATQKRNDAKQAWEEGKGENVSLMNIKDPTDLKRVIKTGDGVYWTIGKDGRPDQSVPIDPQYTEFSAGTGGTVGSAATLADKILLKGVDSENAIRLAGIKTKLADGLEVSKEDRAFARAQESDAKGVSAAAAERIAPMALQVTQITDFLNNPELANVTGRKSLLEQGQAWAGIGEKAPAYQTVIKESENIANVPILEFLEKVKPATEGEYRIARKAAPTIEDLPSVHINYHLKNTGPDIQDAYSWAIENATSDEEAASRMEERDAVLGQWYGEMATAAAQYPGEVSPESLKRYGFPDKYVRLVKLMQEDLLDQREADKNGTNR